MIEEKLRSIQPPKLISSLDKKGQMIMIVVIQPATIGDAQKRRSQSLN